MTTNTAVSTTEEVIHVNLKCIGEYTHEGNSIITFMPDALFLIYLTSLLNKPSKKKSTTNDTSEYELSKLPVTKLQQEPLDLIMSDGSMSVIHVFNMTFPMEYALTGSGYIDHGHGKWLSPHSSSGSAGSTTVQSVNNPWGLMWTHHASDGALRGAMHDSFDLAAHHAGISKKELSKQQAAELKAIDPATGKQLDITVDEYNKQNWRNNQTLPNQNKSTGSQFVLNTITGTALLKLNLPPPYFIIPELLPAGRTLFIAHPKYGKSWLMTYFGMFISQGLPIFGRKTNRQRVLYMALEDSDFRLSHRTGIVMDQFNIAPNALDLYHLTTSTFSIDNGFQESVLDFLATYPDTALIIVDVLAKIRPSKEPKSIYKADYAIGNALAPIVNMYPNLAIIVVHHANKGDKTDTVGMVSGSNGLAGGFDNVFSINNDKLHLRGRDLDENYEIDLLKDDQGRYTMSAPSITTGMEPTRLKVYQYIEACSNKNQLVAPKEIVQATGLTKGDVQQQLTRLLGKGLINKPSKGKYTL